jgi:hypothetical protein
MVSLFAINNIMKTISIILACLTFSASAQQTFFKPVERKNGSATNLTLVGYLQLKGSDPLDGSVVWDVKHHDGTSAITATDGGVVSVFDTFGNHASFDAYGLWLNNSNVLDLATDAATAQVKDIVSTAKIQSTNISGNFQSSGFASTNISSTNYGDVFPGWGSDQVLCILQPVPTSMTVTSLVAPIYTFGVASMPTTIRVFEIDTTNTFPNLYSSSIFSNKITVSNANSLANSTKLIGVNFQIHAGKYLLVSFTATNLYSLTIGVSTNLNNLPFITGVSNTGVLGFSHTNYRSASASLFGLVSFQPMNLNDYLVTLGEGLSRTNATDISLSPGTGLTGTTVQSAFAEINNSFHTFNPSNTAILFNGDSLTSFPNTNALFMLTNNWPYFVTNTPCFNFFKSINVAYPGRSINDMTNHYVSEVLPQALGLGTNGVTWFCIGANAYKYISSYDPQDAIGALISYCTNIASIGYTHIGMITVPPRSDPGDTMSAKWETNRLALNEWIRTNQFAQWRVDAAALLPDNTDANLYMSDLVHWTPTAESIIAANVIAAMSTPAIQAAKIPWTQVRDKYVIDSPKNGKRLASINLDNGILSVQSISPALASAPSLLQVGGTNIAVEWLSNSAPPVKYATYYDYNSNAVNKAIVTFP